MPKEVLETAKLESTRFEEELLQRAQGNDATDEDDDPSFTNMLVMATENADLSEITRIYDEYKYSCAS